MNRQYKPFAITARTIGIPQRLSTRLLVVNLRSRYKLAAKYVNALWDTGAATCVMSADLARALGFEFSKSVPSKSIGHETVNATYGYVYVALVSNGDIIETIAAVVDESLGDGYSFIIGMDFISKGSLAISCSPGKTMLSFTIPTSQEIDFVKLLQDDGIVKGEIELGISGSEDPKIYYGAEVIELLHESK